MRVIYYVNRSNISLLLGKTNLNSVIYNILVPCSLWALEEEGRRRDCIIRSLYTLIYCFLSTVNKLYYTFFFWYSLQVLFKFSVNVSAYENNRWIILFTVREGYYLNFTTQLCQQTSAMLWNSPAALLRPLLMERRSELSQLGVGSERWHWLFWLSISSQLHSSLFLFN